MMATEFPIVVQHKDVTLKLYNWMDYPKDKPIRNVEAFDPKGKSLWVIEALGGDSRIDFYTSVSSRGEEIHAFNFQCYDCVIDGATGKVVSSSFAK